ncbi:restriction endonuclease subunit S [Prevotella melaninogenica]|uniref:restriction endonuclease subunit S n=1 Tax=Prevotella melaninogenica TaxID=28132 RepID=UPI001BAD71FF|nr:restriction endonuclease subunit S [Prevotella melaninogenica]QUB64554.1 restriction endonuclease subunit S [Prevotella melaninogenica]
MDTKKLRQKILDLAIHGKLVPQDPNDEPASVLLERIRAEKERLIKEGKIKRSRKTTKTSDATCDEQEVPFEVPSGWVWTIVDNIAPSILYGINESAKTTGKYKLLRITDIQENYVNWNYVPFTDYDEDKAKSYLLKDGDIVFARTGATVGKSYLVEGINQETLYASYLIRVQPSKYILTKYVKLFFESNYYWEQIKLNSVGIGQPNVNGTILGKLNIPIPPFTEQQRIVEEIERWFKLIDIIEQGKTDLQSTIKQAKNKILDLAIHGKLVPQDPNDEPALELLKRINPKAEITCDNGHYPKLPKGWAICRLEDIVEYEQPTAYIVKSTAYSDDYSTPVLTAGKSFIIGYTDETEGIYNNLPCIIFDDFTTASRLVDFPFKVKSSAMKILQVNKGVDIKYVSQFMSITRLVGDTHKRYWISEYSKLEIPIPPQKEQLRIIRKIQQLFKNLETIEESL